MATQLTHEEHGGEAAGAEPAPAEVVWTGHKSKRSNVLGSGGYSAQAHGARLKVQECGDGRWSYTVEVVRVGLADTAEAARAEALAAAARIDAAG